MSFATLPVLRQPSLKFERKFRIDDAVLKYLTIKTADAITEDDIQKAIAEADAKLAAAKETSRMKKLTLSKRICLSNRISQKKNRRIDAFL